MRQLRYFRHVCAIGALLATGLVLVACGSSDKKSSSSTTKSSSSTSSSSGSGLAAANKLLAPYTGHPSEFPTGAPFNVKPGLKFAYVDCGSPVCALFGTITEGAVKAAGGKLVVVKAGSSAQGIQKAFDSVVSLKPDAVIAAGVSPALFQRQAKELTAMKIPIGSTGMGEDAVQLGLDKPPNTLIYGPNGLRRTGQVLAAYVYKTKGDKTNVGIIQTPELTFFQVEVDSFKQTMSQLCPNCKVRVIKTPIASLGSTAPSLIVSDLQAHPDTNIVAGGDCENVTGLPQALKKGGLSTTIVCAGSAPPVTLQYIKSGQVKGNFALDLAIDVFSMVDADLRTIYKQPIPKVESEGLGVFQIVEQKDLTGDISKGFATYPDFAQRFIKSWHGGK
jgi:ribose transport system substrate-binding protein